jgi:lactoylglutathione lyase
MQSAVKAMPTRPNLTVIRCADPDVSAAFYRLIGLEFEKHRHGAGPEHHAASDGSWAFELYPASARFPACSSTRIGFAVESCDEVVERLQRAGFEMEVAPAESDWGRRAVAVDPDGHRVELVSRGDN